MRISNIRFIQGEVEGDLGAIPSEVTVTMSITEAAVIARYLGDLVKPSLRK